MRFTDFLKATVMLMAGEATALVAIAVASASLHGDRTALIESIGFWLLAGVAGSLVGRRTRASAGIDTLLVDARTESLLPEIHPTAVLVNRLWPFGVFVLVTAAPAFAYPQVPAIGAAFLIFSALAWRNQEKAVTAIEVRDGAFFYLTLGSPFRRPQLVRTPGMRRVGSAD